MKAFKRDNKLVSVSITPVTVGYLRLPFPIPDMRFARRDGLI
jgi:hypothetical protein